MRDLNEVMGHQNQQQIKQQIKLGPKSLRFITIIFFSGLILFYLAQTTQGATKKYEMNDLINKKEELLTQKEQLEVEAAKLKSIQKIEEGVKDSNMVPIKEIERLDQQK